MRKVFQNIYAAGFDLDNTLYQLTPQIEDRIRKRISERILERMPILGTVELARDHFERRFKRLQSGTKVLQEVGYKNAGEVMDACLSEAEVLDFIVEDRKLADIMQRIHDAYKTYLITSGPRDLALAKLNKIGIDSRIFYISLYSDYPKEAKGLSKRDGTAFEYILKKSEIDPTNHVYVGDRVSSDILPAKKLGMRTIAVWTGFQVKEADLSLKHIHEIEGVLLDG